MAENVPAGWLLQFTYDNMAYETGQLDGITIVLFQGCLRADKITLHILFFKQ